MKIGVLSDSHDNLPNIRRALEVLRAAGAEALIHAGDFVAPFAVRELLKFGGGVYGVFGNNDGERAGIRKIWEQVYDPPHLFVLGGRRIGVMHERIPSEKLPADLRSAEVFIYGHTHTAAIAVLCRGIPRPGRAHLSGEPGGALFINPGEAGGWLTGQPTIAMLDTEKLEATLLEL